MKEKIAEFIGILLGDGSIGHYECKAGDKIKHQYVVKATLDSRNGQYLKHVNSIFQDVLGTIPKITYRRNENTVDIRLFGRKIFNYVTTELGLIISPKWGNMKIPEKYFNEDAFPSILKGLFDTDGCLSLFSNHGQVYPRIEIKICPSPIQNQIITILKKLNFTFRIQNLKNGQMRFRISGIKELEKWFRIIGSSNNIHIDKYNRILETKNL